MPTHPPARSLAKKTQKVQEIDLCSSTPPASRDPTPANDSPGAIEIMTEAERCLREVWGYQSFRGVQEAVIRRLCWESESAAVVMPTGGGKSLIYQLPALLLPGLTVVVSPLLALMKDQVDTLRLRGVPAASLDSTLDMNQAACVKEDVRAGKIKLLYVAPERLNNEMFLDMMMHLERISMVAVDEAHCIAEWGPSFRPDYLKVARFAREVGAERVLALTATATPSVAQAICDGFSIDSASGLFKTSTYRSNLSLNVAVAETVEQKLLIMTPMLKSRTGACIIYVTTQSDAEELVNILLGVGFPEARMYHAGMKTEDRQRVQEEFIASDRGLVCCTIAFGMGIDKATIRQIIHYKVPKTLENYSQEIGRAGRDGLPSHCLVLLSSQDIPMLEGFARGNTPSLRSMKSWLTEVLSTDLDEDGCLVFNHYEQGKVHDIKTTTLTLLFAQLELAFNLIRATTPYYSTFQWRHDHSALQKMRAETSKVSRAIISRLKQGPTFCSIDVCEAARISGIKRSELAAQINKWERSYGIQPKGSLVRARYRPMTPDGTVPGRDAIDRVATALYDAMFKREEADVARLHDVVELLTKEDCLAHSLCGYFGDKESVPLESCRSCTYCATLEPTEFNQQIQTKVDVTKAQAILKACPYRDDARLLARIAFGIGSPRTTELKLGKASDGGPFGCMDTTDFNMLVEYFDKECKSAGHKNLAVKSSATKVGSSSSPHKRKAPTSSGPNGRSNKQPSTYGSSGIFGGSGKKNRSK